ncbi:unnamed protein product [Rotaria magnacalcarata]
MNILQLNELTDDMMNLSLDNFYNFIEIALDKDLRELFQVQAIREISSLSSVTIDQLTQVFTFEIYELKVQAKKAVSVKNRESSNNFIENDINKKLIELLKHQTSNLSDGYNVSILIPWIINIFQNLKTTKNKYSYDIHIQQFALLIYILGGRNCYEFLRLNLSGSLPHISNTRWPKSRAPTEKSNISTNSQSKEADFFRHWWMSGKSLHAVNTAFKHEFPDDAVPARQTIYRLSSKFEEFEHLL